MTRWILALSLLALAACGGGVEEHRVTCPTPGSDEPIKIRTNADEGSVIAVTVWQCSAEMPGLCSQDPLALAAVRDGDLTIRPSGCRAPDEARVVVEYGK